MDTGELLKEFTEEALEHINLVESELLKLETGTGDADTIHNIFRAMHSIKGTAGFFSLQNIVELAHTMENIFDQVRNGNLVISEQIITRVLGANDLLNKLVRDIDNSNEVDISDHLSKLAEVTQSRPAAVGASEDPGAPLTGGLQLEGEHSSAPADYQSILTDAAKHGRKIFKVLHQGPQQMLEEFTSIGQVVCHYRPDTRDPSADSSQVFIITTVLEADLVAAALDMPEQNIEELDVTAVVQECNKKDAVIDEPTEPVETEKEPSRRSSEINNSGGSNTTNTLNTDGSNSKTWHSNEAVRVNINLLNDLLNLASEMVLGRNRLLRVVETHRKDIPGLNGVLQNIDRITTELQEKVMQTRMLPLAKVFHKFPRLTRELSRQTGKDITLKITGNDVELDKSIIESLGDPLTHLVRNAIDHGIETPERREQAGKLKTGTINLKAYHEGGHVIIDVVDDGRGIDAAKIKDKALEKNLVDAGELALMGERELLDLLFRPGFSTADKVTDLSGRGVGLDVVKSNIEKLGGVMEILNNPGQGTTFRLTLPITLAIVHSLLVEVENLKFALPQVNLQEMVRIKAEEAAGKLQIFQDSMVLRLRGKLVPTVRLSEILGIEQADVPLGRLIRVLVVKSGSKRFGLIVDHILDDEEILVKPLPRHLQDCQCYSGMTVLGDGKIAMILDLEGITAKAGFKFSEEEADASGEPVAADDLNEQQNLLIFKCSGPETFCIDLGMVARVEKITAEQIETIGDKEFIQFRDSALRVIRPEDYLPVVKTEHSSSKLFVIIPKTVKHPIGILISQIVDTVETNITFNPNDIKKKGLLGSTVLNNRITLVINMYELFELADPEHFISPPAGDSAAQKATVLLVEDTPFFAKMEKNYLETAGYQVITAANGKEALALLQQHEVDLVVSDIVMPVMNGYELVKRIRSDRRLANLPVMAVTTRNDQKSMQEGKAAGFDYYEIKLDKDSFLSKVRLALADSHIERTLAD